MDTHTFSRHETLLIFTVALLVFLLPSIMRFIIYDNPAIVGFPTHFHERIAEDIINGDFDFYDELSFGGRVYTYPPGFVFSLAFFSLFLGTKMGGVIFLGLVGSLSVVFLYMIAKELCPEIKKNRLIATVFIVFTPGMIYLFSHLSTRSPPIMLGLLAMLIILKYTKPGKMLYLSAVSLGVSFLFHPETGIIFSFLCFFLLKRFHAKYFLVAGVIACLWYVPFFLSHGIPEFNALHEDYRENRYSLETPSVENYIWEAGKDANYGNLNIIVTVLAVVGLFFSSRYMKYWFISLFLLSLFAERFIIYLIFPATILAVTGFNRLRKKGMIKYVLMILVVSYSLSIAAWRINDFASSWPTKEQYDAFKWLESNTSEQNIILSDWTWGHWISGIANRKNFMDGYAEYAPGVNKRMSEMDLFYENCTVPEGYNITYIYMEQWMIEKRNISCIHKFDAVYNKDGILIFKA